MDCKWAWGNFGNDRYVHYLDQANDFTSVYSIYTFIKAYQIVHLK